MLEAIKYQKPLIISNCDGPKTIIKNNINGILVEKSPIENLPQNFSKSIIKLINNPDLVFDLVTNAQNNLLKNYSIKAIKERMAEIIKIAFGTLGLEYEKYLVIDPKFFRPSEETILRGDCSKAKKVLNWQSEITFEQLVTLMTEADFQLLKNKH